MEKELNKRLLFSWFLKNGERRTRPQIDWMCKNDQLQKVAENHSEYIEKTYNSKSWDDIEIHFILPEGKATTESLQRTLRLYAFEIKTLILQKHVAKIAADLAAKKATTKP